MSSQKTIQKFNTPSSNRGMVVSPHYQASMVGVDILRKGGSAVDAAIAANAALCVVYPHMCGLGGDLFAQVWDSKRHELTGINASGRSGESATIDLLQSGRHKTLNLRGPLSAITVPGTIDGWWNLHKQFGKIRWEVLFQYAIKLAAGFPISPKLSQSIRDHLNVLSLSSSAIKTFTNDGNPLGTGEMLNQPELARSLDLIAKSGPDIFYKGELGEKITEGLKEAGGVITREDFFTHVSEWVSPIRSEYHDLSITHMPPNSQGIILLMMLNMLECHDWKDTKALSVDYYHLLTEVYKRTLKDKEKWITDPTSISIPLEKLASKEYGQELYASITFENSTKEIDQVSPSTGDTVYICAIDSAGMAVSLIQSIFLEFGSGIMPKGTGILLQNRGAMFSLDPTHPNHLAPRKRTFHTLMPTMVFKDEKPLLLLGTMGGMGQPQTLATIITNLIDFKMNLWDSINAPRWFFGRIPSNIVPNLYVESRISDSIIEELKCRSHFVKKLPAYSKFMGHAQAILIDEENNTLFGVADPRGDGMALSE